MPEKKTFLMGIPGSILEMQPEPDMDTDARPKRGAHVGAEGGYEHPGEVFQRESGIWALEPGTLRTWIKFAGEPAEVLFEPPALFTERWLAFVADESQVVMYAHTYTDGEAFAIFRPAIPHLWKVGISYQSTGPRPHARSIWERNCPCPLCTA